MFYYNSNNSDNYRFYHCYEKHIGLICKLVDNPYQESNEINSKLLFVPKFVPKFMDRYILEYNYKPSKTIIM
jgi:hypothetical protein